MSTNRTLFAGKELLISETALRDFHSILATVGGDREKERARELLTRVTVVPDCPSPRTQRLKGSGKIKARPKVRNVFLFFAPVLCKLCDVVKFVLFCLFCFVCFAFICFVSMFCFVCFCFHLFCFHLFCFHLFFFLFCFHFFFFFICFVVFCFVDIPCL